MKVVLERPCPFCDGKYAVSVRPPAVMHTLPGCINFALTTGDVFLIDAREAEEEAEEAAGRVLQ